MPDSAAVHYQHVVNAWRAADRQFVPRQEAAAPRLEAIGLQRSRRNATRSQHSIEAAAEQVAAWLEAPTLHLIGEGEGIGRGCVRWF